MGQSLDAHATRATRDDREQWWTEVYARSWYVAMGGALLGAEGVGGIQSTDAGGL